MPNWRSFFDKLFEAIEPVVIHGLGMIIAILSLWIVELVLKYTVGSDMKFFDVIPVEYSIQLGDIFIIARFLYRLLKEFK